jgi:hypothetical protein
VKKTNVRRYRELDVSSNLLLGPLGLIAVVLDNIRIEN